MDDGKIPLGHQVEAIVAGAQYLLGGYQERAGLLRAVLRAIDQFDVVSALVRSSDSAATAESALMDLLDIDEAQARAVAGMQVLKLAAREHQRLAEEYAGLLAGIADLESILASPERQSELAGTDRGEYLARRDNRREADSSDADDRADAPIPLSAVDES